MHEWIQERVSETGAVPADSAPTRLHIFCTKSFQRYESQNVGSLTSLPHSNMPLLP